MHTSQKSIYLTVNDKAFDGFQIDVYLLVKSHQVDSPKLILDSTDEEVMLKLYKRSCTVPIKFVVLYAGELGITFGRNKPEQISQI